MEVWECDRSEEAKEQLSGTVMDRNKEDEYLMQMNGTTMHSSGYRGNRNRAEAPIIT